MSTQKTTHSHTITNSYGYFKALLITDNFNSNVLSFSIEFSVFMSKYKIYLNSDEYTKISMETMGYALAPAQFFQGICKSDFAVRDGYLEVYMDKQKSIIFKYLLERK